MILQFWETSECMLKPSVEHLAYCISCNVFPSCFSLKKMHIFSETALNFLWRLPAVSSSVSERPSEARRMALATLTHTLSHPFILYMFDGCLIVFHLFNYLGAAKILTTITLSWHVLLFCCLESRWKQQALLTGCVIHYFPHKVHRLSIGKRHRLFGKSG